MRMLRSIGVQLTIVASSHMRIKGHPSITGSLY